MTTATGSSSGSHPWWKSVVPAGPVSEPSTRCTPLPFRVEGRNPPDPLEVVTDGPVGGEEPTPGGVEDRPSGPSLGVPPGGVDFILGGDVGPVVGQHEELVMAEEVVDQRAQPVRFPGGEPPGGNGVDGPAELLVRFVEGPRPVPGRPGGADLFLGEPEKEEVLRPDQLADLDVGPVERPDGQGAVERQ